MQRFNCLLSAEKIDWSECCNRSPELNFSTHQELPDVGRARSGRVAEAFDRIEGRAPSAKPQSFMPPSDYRTSTAGYYDRHVAAFCENTFTVDVSALYVPFLREIPEGGAILDAGCGSGRDSLAFLRRGYRVVSIDASPEMVAAATKNTGQQTLLLRFDEIDFTDEFDGIWACGSLLHVARRDLHSVFARFSRALKPNGVIYLSFKYGDTERMEEERFFNDMNEATLGLFLCGHSELELVHLWITEDLRNYARGYQSVLNALVRRNALSKNPREALAHGPLQR